MDALDARILREFGIDPFTSWPRRKAGLKLSDVARRMDRNLQFVKDRVERMESDGVITGYRAFPNLRQMGLDFTTFIWPTSLVPDKQLLSRLGTVDGFVGVVWSLDSCLCVDITHAGPAEKKRRLELVGQLLGVENKPSVLFHRPFPDVKRRLSPLDWRIIGAMADDARRPLSDVAKELGVTAKTVRSRYHTMWGEGCIDTHVVLDFERMSGLFPFAISFWYEEGASGASQRILDHFEDRLLDVVEAPSGDYCSFQIRIFAYTPAEVQALVREGLALEGVQRAEPFLATGAYYDERWLQELLSRQVQSEAVRLPESGVRG